MEVMVLSVERFFKVLREKYEERLLQIEWGKNAVSITEALNFYSETMMEKTWTEEEKRAFQEFLFEMGFQVRTERKKAQVNCPFWYFPKNTKVPVLKEIYNSYYASQQQAIYGMEQKAKEELTEFCKSEWQTTIMASQNRWYRSILNRVLDKSYELFGIHLKWKETERKDWILVSKTGQFFNLVEDFEARTQDSIVFYMKYFLESINQEIVNYHRRWLRNHDEILPRHFSIYLPSYAYQEIQKAMTVFGFHFSYFPQTYKNDYILAGLKFEKHLQAFITIDPFAKLGELEYGMEVAKQCRRFNELFH